MAHRNDCRICGGTELVCFLELGPTPLANAFLPAGDEGHGEQTYPLDLYLCPRCSLVQVCEVVPPEVLFRNYVYVSGTSQTMPRHFAELATDVADRFLVPGALVVEPAANDGTLLSSLQQRDLRLLGVEPAINIAQMARARGIDTINEFFSDAVATSILASHGPAGAVIATNVFAHVDQLGDFTQGVARLLGPDGVFVMEASYIFDTLTHLEFDSVYHEHLCFFSVTALGHLLALHGLEIFDVRPQPVHGGSIRVFAHRKGALHAIEPAVATYLDEEARRGVLDLAIYRAFAERTYALKVKLVTLLKELRAQGKSIVAYGASAKGNTLLNFMKIGPELVSYVVDKSPLKQGTRTPGMHLPVYGVERLALDRPDFALLLAWNFVPEIVSQQREYLEGGGRFIVPIPEPIILAAGDVPSRLG